MTHAFLIVLASYALTVIVLEGVFLKRFFSPAPGSDAALGRSVNWRRITVKLLGLYGTLGVLALAYAAFPEYRGNFFSRYWEMLQTVFWPMVILSVPYFIVIDRGLAEPEDGTWHAGQFFLGNWGQSDKKILGQHALGWLVKAFFLPLMYTYFTNDLIRLREADLHAATTGFMEFFQLANDLIFFVDVGLTTAGYLLTMRLFDSHIRSTEPTFFGWWVALVCYKPFWGSISNGYLWYEGDGYQWTQWLSHQPMLQAGWGLMILLCYLLYVSATVSFGIRFSNLTHRGIVTGGPYRWTKHPAYVGKCLSFWLISIPFIPKNDPVLALKSCLLLLGVNGVYYLRARTEERHLSKDPIYVQYALAMNEKSIFGPLGKIMPFLWYRPPVS